MKFNKLTIGLGVMAVMMASCDKAADQTYDPAKAVATPEVYFTYDYDPDVLIDEFQTEFTVPVYRARTNGEQIVKVNLNTTGAIFTYNDPTADQNVNDGYVPVAEGDNVLNVKFEDGQDVTEIPFRYEWLDMAAKAGVEFTFDFSVAADATPYFPTAADYTVLYVPWENIVGPEGETQAKVIDGAVGSGFTLGGQNAIFEYYVTIQSNEINKDVFRILTPYDNITSNGPDADQMGYLGGCKDMYINAKDPKNVYLCNKKGEPEPLYETKYYIIKEYGPTILWDRAAGSILKKEYVYNGEAVPNAGYGAGEYETMTVGGKTLPSNIVMDVKHFNIFNEEFDYVNVEPFQIVFPGGKEKSVWQDMGMAKYTDGTIWWLDNGTTTTYEVPMQKHTEKEGVYRLVNPYTNYWPESNPMDEDYDIVIDCSDPVFVMVDAQATGNYVTIDGEMGDAYLMNAAYVFTEFVTKGRLTREQIIQKGLNDTFKDGEISLVNVALAAVDADGSVFGTILMSDEDSPGNKVVLPVEQPTEEESESLALKSAKNRITGLNYHGTHLKLRAQKMNLRIR